MVEAAHHFFITIYVASGSGKVEVNMKKKNIYLMLLPFWTPLIPPLGVACLKSHLTSKGHKVHISDGNVDMELSETHTDYFKCLKEIIPSEKRGNFYNIGMNVLRDHLMAYFNKVENELYFQAVKEIVRNYFFIEISNSNAESLDKIIKFFYEKLDKYLDNIFQAEIPDVVGVSVYSGTLAPSLYAIKKVKEAHPQVLTIIGGGIFSSDLCLGSENLRVLSERYDYIDKIIIGEGEILLEKILEDQIDNSKKIYSHFDINKETYDIAKAYIPDFTNLYLDKYPYVALYASRSCPYQCNFCTETIQWGKYRKKSADQIVSELNNLFNKYKHQLFLFGDSLLNPIINELSEELIKSDLFVYWDGYLRASSNVTEDNAYLWRRGGFYRARLGIESGSQNVLNLMNKNLTIEQIKNSIKNLANAGIKTTTYWVIGYPGETEEDFEETLSLIKYMKDDIYEADCNPFNYYLDGQVGSKTLLEKGEVKTLYDKKYHGLLPVNTYVLDTTPTREETYDRVCRFIEFCKENGIPNPYSLADIHEADLRWKKIHKNSVPLLLEFNRGGMVISESKKIKKPAIAKCEITNLEGDFSL